MQKETNQNTLSELHKEPGLLVLSAKKKFATGWMCQLMKMLPKGKLQEKQGVTTPYLINIASVQKYISQNCSAWPMKEMEGEAQK